MRAGKRRHKITIQHRTVTQNEYGGEVETWSTYSTPWAHREYLNSKEYFEARAINNEVGVRFRILYDVGITDTMRVKDENGSIYEIEAILPDSQSGRREITLVTTLNNAESA